MLTLLLFFFLFEFYYLPLKIEKYQYKYQTGFPCKQFDKTEMKTARSMQNEIVFEFKRITWIFFLNPTTVRTGVFVCKKKKK